MPVLTLTDAELRAIHSHLRGHPVADEGSLTDATFKVEVAIWGLDLPPIPQPDVRSAIKTFLAIARELNADKPTGLSEPEDMPRIPFIRICAHGAFNTSRGGGVGFHRADGLRDQAAG